MTEFDDLGEALRQQLHAAVADLTPSTELIASVEAIPSRGGALGRLRGRGSRPRRLALALTAPVAATVAAVVFLFGGSGVAPSYASAIRVLPDGEVRVLLAELGDVRAANAVLREHHIHNMLVVPMTASCPYRKGFTYFADASMNRPPPPVVTLMPETLPPDSTDVLAAKRVGRDILVSAVAPFKGRLPTCASVYGTGPGMGNVTVSRP